MLRRAAGAALGIGKSLFKGMGPTEIVGRLAPDVFFGALEGLNTPGDLGDKIIAGSGAAIGGGVGGLALGKLGGNNPVGFLLDMGGSVGGDMIGRMGSDTILRAKDSVSGGKGQTPFEKLNEQQMQELIQSGKMQALAELGLLPSSAQQALVDPYTGMGVS